MQVDRNQVSRREEVFVEQQGGHIHKERIVEDVNLAHRQSVARIAQLIWLFFGVVDGFIGIRILLKLIAANPNNGFTSLVYQLTDLFLWPFFSLTGSPSFENYVFEIPSVIAMFVYIFVGWVIVRLVWIVFYRTPTSRVSTYDREDM